MCLASLYRIHDKLYFFFYYYVDLRDLHSFPTRRSSDLGGWVVQPLLTMTCPACGAEFRQRMQRSEEHTSELQSREKLVCRLLLEKKKWKTSAWLRSIGSTRNRTRSAFTTSR